MGLFPIVSCLLEYYILLEHSKPPTSLSLFSISTLVSSSNFLGQFSILLESGSLLWLSILLEESKTSLSHSSALLRWPALLKPVVDLSLVSALLILKRNCSYLATGPVVVGHSVFEKVSGTICSPPCAALSSVCSSCTQCPALGGCSCTRLGCHLYISCSGLFCSPLLSYVHASLSSTGVVYHSCISLVSWVF